MKLLIEKGADVNALNNANESPIYNAAKGGDPEAIQLLLDAGADPNIPQKDGRRPIHEAARWGKDWAVTLYLEHGADVNAQDNEGSTPLHEAVLWGKAWDDADVPELLIEVRLRLIRLRLIFGYNMGHQPFALIFLRSAVRHHMLMPMHGQSLLYPCANCVSAWPIFLTDGIDFLHRAEGR
jgi:ankyrin repeat protein